MTTRLLNLNTSRSTVTVFHKLAAEAKNDMERRRLWAWLIDYPCHVPVPPVPSTRWTALDWSRTAVFEVPDSELPDPPVPEEV